jgi:hypothetical protein
MAGRGKPNCTATARAEHHLLRIDRRLPWGFEGKEGAVDRERCSIRALRHQRDHRWPGPTRGMPQTGMEAERAARQQVYSTRDQVALDGRSLRRHRGLPDGKRALDALGSAVIWFVVEDSATPQTY